MQRILVFTPPEDEARRAIRLAAELARQTGASLTLLRVLEETAGWNLDQGAPQCTQSIRELLEETASRELEALADLAREMTDHSIVVATEVAWGVPWEVVIELVHSLGFDLVVKPARGSGGSGRVFFGTTALHLFRRCPCPVWVVGNDGRLPRKMLVAIDPMLDRTRRNMAARLFQWGQRIQQMANSRLEVASAWHAPGAEVLKEKLDREDWDQYVENSRARAATALGTLLSAHVGTWRPDDSHLLEGHARDVVPAFAESEDFDLLVVGAVGRTGLAGELLGETAESIVRAVQCSVLVVSPGRPAAAADGTGERRGSGEGQTPARD